MGEEIAREKMNEGARREQATQGKLRIAYAIRPSCPHFILTLNPAPT